MSPARAALVVATVLAIAWGSIAHAARVFPENSFQARVTRVADDSIDASGRTLHLAPGVLVYTPTNTTLVKSALPSDVLVRIQLDFQGEVRRIWLLADDEVVRKPWWMFWKSEQTQEQANRVQLVPVE